MARIAVAVLSASVGFAVTSEWMAVAAPITTKALVTVAATASLVVVAREIAR